MEEIWKIMPNHPECQISNYGRYKNKYDKITFGCNNGDGYFGCRFGLIHRFVALLFIGPSPEGKKFINHKDLNKSNNL